ncbi:hypothetical protein K1719_004248 [Acacia pycnantha]|nr:hypothetical protein K1719_004248 [Acacia pycnantha]
MLVCLMDPLLPKSTYRISNKSPMLVAQMVQQQQRQHLSNYHVSYPSRLESEMCGEDSPSTTDSRLSHATMSIYGHNVTMPVQPPNFAMMTPGAMGGVSAATVANGSHSKKKQQQYTGAKDGNEAS